MLKEYTDWVFDLLNKYVVLRYLIGGGTAGVTDLVVLYLLHDLFKIHYLVSAVIAFIVAFCVSFLFHKFWTFKSHSEATHKQVMMYLGSSLFGLGLNTLLMYVSVDHFHINVILSQIYVGLLVACCTFFISRNLVFKYKPQ